MKYLLVEEVMSGEPITVHPRTSVPAAYHLMRLNDIRRLPVVDDAGYLMGIVTLGDVAKARPRQHDQIGMWDFHYRAASMEVHEVMTLRPITVTPTTTLPDAAQLMLENKVGGLPVVDDGEVVGMITESDIFRVVVRYGLFSQVDWNVARQVGVDPASELTPG